MSWLVPLPVILPLVGAGLAVALSRFPRVQRATSVAVLAATVTTALALVFATDDGPIVVNVGSWAAPIGIALVADRLSTLMLAVSNTVAMCVFLYSLAQGLNEDDTDTPVAIYHPTYLTLTAGVAIAFLAGDLFNLYVGFEVLLVSSYVLITMGGTGVRIRAGTTYVVVSVVSSVLFLVAVALLYGATGTTNLALMAQRLPELDPGVALVLQFLLLIAFAIKAAVFPLSAWLPDSYPTAPAPVTAVFAGLLTKVGVYAIIRTHTLLFGDGQPSTLLLTVACLTMVIGVFGALAQDDVRRILSFHIISQIGYMLVGVALMTPLAIAGSVLYIVHHIIVKANLFLVAGAIRQEGGSFALARLGGLWLAAPMLALLFLVPALSLAGMPPLSGFWGKLLVIRASLEADAFLLAAAALIVGMLTLYSMVKIWNEAFWKAAPAAAAAPRWTARQRAASYAPIVALAAVTVTIGLWTEPFAELSLVAAESLLDRQGYVAAVLGQGAWQVAEVLQ